MELADRKVFSAELAHVMALIYACAGLIVGLYVAQLMLSHASPVLGCLGASTPNPNAEILYLSASLYLAFVSAIVIIIQLSKLLLKYMKWNQRCI